MNSNTIIGSTTVLAVFGDPVSHSLSPLMHNAAFSALDWNCVYIPCRVQSEQLSIAVRSIQALNWKGVNITIPYKQAVQAELDQISGDAEKSGSVNTIINRDNQLIGTSTDGIGFLRSLQEEGHFEVKEKNVILFGAGGAARAVIYSLINAGIKSLTIVNRNFEKANDLRLQVLDKTGFALSVYDLSKLEEINWDLYDLLINSTSVGLHDEQSLVPVIYLKPKHFVYDMVYKRGDTKLSRDAKQVGCQSLSGLSMLLYQGAESFQLWFESDPPIDAMRRALYQYYE
ncbi:MAG TPA: shikimate dehydrogenase [Firmicutes bacterium]|jgi:shikimate dehydrogenase|nr:shikimate dehydrogenase [Bacillota bacterium]